MKFDIEVPMLEEALSAVSKLASPESGNIVITGGKRLRIHSSSQVNSVVVSLPVKCGDGEFGIPIETLRQAAKGRKHLECEYKNTLLYLKDGRYKAELTTVDAIRDDSVAVDSFKSAVKFSADQMAELRSLVQQVALKPNSLIASFMPCGVRIDKKQAFVACYDSIHMAFIKSKEIKVKNPIEFVLPLDTLALIATVFIGGARMSINDSVVEIKDDRVTAVLSLPTLDSELPSMNEVVELSKSVRKASGNVLSFDKKEFVKFLDNGRSVSVRERSEIVCSVANSRAQFSILTSSGAIKASFKHKGEMNFKVDFEYLDEIVRKCGDELEFVLVGDSYLKTKSKDGYLVTGLNQDG